MMGSIVRQSVLLLGCSGAACGAAPVASLEAEAAALLARNCLECHNPSDRKGGLDLTSRQRALAGGDSGRVLIPGEPAASPLLTRLQSKEMPPHGRPALKAD